MSRRLFGHLLLLIVTAQSILRFAFLLGTTLLLLTTQLLAVGVVSHVKDITVPRSVPITLVTQFAPLLCELLGLIALALLGFVTTVRQFRDRPDARGPLRLWLQGNAIIGMAMLLVILGNAAIEPSSDRVQWLAATVGQLRSQVKELAPLVLAALGYWLTRPLEGNAEVAAELGDAVQRAEIDAVLPV